MRDLPDSESEAHFLLFVVLLTPDKSQFREFDVKVEIWRFFFNFHIRRIKEEEVPIAQDTIKKTLRTVPGEARGRGRVL